MIFKSSILLACLAVVADARFFGDNTNPVAASIPKINNNYIVVYKSNATASSMGSARSWSTSSFRAQVKKTNIAKNLGMFIDVLDLTQSPQGVEQAAALLAKHPDVAFVEKDGIATTAATQMGATWGLDRVDQRNLPLNNQYQYDDVAGAGVKVYVTDTGIKVDNPEFEGRATWGADFTGEGFNDQHGHGTHCSGTVGSKTYGVAKKASIIAVKVLRAAGWGYYSDIIAGTDFAALNCGGGKCIISMSIQGGFSRAYNTAIDNAFKKGVIPVVCAGNFNVDACTFSPASTVSAITVGATDIIDKRAGFSNYGRCVDIHAPGVDVTSVTTCNFGTTDCIATWSGTSMATPHVAGIAALVWAKNPSLTSTQVISRVYGMGTKGVLTGLPPYTPNLLAYSIF